MQNNKDWVWNFNIVVKKKLSFDHILLIIFITPNTIYFSMVLDT